MKACYKIQKAKLEVNSGRLSCGVGLAGTEAFAYEGSYRIVFKGKGIAFTAAFGSEVSGADQQKDGKN